MMSFHTLMMSMLGFMVVLFVDGRSAKAEFIFSAPTNLGPVINSRAAEAGPCISADGLLLLFDSDRLDGLGSYDLWMATRSTTDEDWGVPVNLGLAVNSSSDEFDASISADGLSLFFASDRAGGSGASDLWVATRGAIDEEWDVPVNLGPTVNSEYEDDSPSVSADGLSLYFSSDRPGTYGDADLWVTRRATVHDNWSRPTNLGPTINSSLWEARPDISSDGLTLLFGSNQLDGGVWCDVYVATRETIDSPWGTPVKLGPVVNSAGDEDWPCISADGRTLLFESDRPGGFGDFDLWQVSIEPIVDFNRDERVDLADFCQLAQYWFHHESSVDIAPAPLGDGKVDLKDLAVLTEYWLADFRVMAHWKLDETAGSIAHDSVGRHDGTLHGNPVWQPIGGKVAGALEFDGTGDYVSIPFVLNPADGAFSVFAWIKGGAPGQVIIAQTGGPALGATWLGADLSQGKLITGLMFPIPSLQSETVITDNQWHHVGLVWDGSRRILYVDGAEVARDTTLPASVAADGGLHFGAGKSFDAESFWSGLIDDVRIYDRAAMP